MKKIIRNNRILLVAFLTIFTTITSAAGVPIDEKSPVPAEIILVGNFQEQPVVKLTINGTAEENDFLIVIADEAGEVLYTENIKGQQFTKKFIFNLEEIYGSKLLFRITCRNTNKTVVYEVSNQEVYAKHTVITKK